MRLEGHHISNLFFPHKADNKPCERTEKYNEDTIKWDYIICQRKKKGNEKLDTHIL